MVGRCSLMFCCLTKGEDESAAIFSLSETSKTNPFDPYDYIC